MLAELFTRGSRSKFWPDCADVQTHLRFCWSTMPYVTDSYMYWSKLFSYYMYIWQGAQWLSGRMLDSRLRGCGCESHQRHCVVSLSKNIYPSLVLVQPVKIHPYITDRLLMGRKESNQTCICHDTLIKEHFW